MRYNIALIATNPEKYINYAQKEFSDFAKGYLLSKNSLPHITVAQFKEINRAKILLLWQEIQDSGLIIPQINLIGVSLTRKNDNLWGISLIVKRCSELVRLQEAIITILKNYSIDCISPTGDLYRPHLTLARIPELKITYFDEQLLDGCNFVLVIGECDENGQFIKIIN